MSRPKDIGTYAETSVVRAAQSRGFPNADRIALHGEHDRGDVGLCPGVIVEVKGGDMARFASDAQVEKWLGETRVERRNAGATVAFLVVQRKGVGRQNAHRWHAYWRLSWLDPEPSTYDARDPVVRMSLGDAFTVLRIWGYGDPL